MSPRQDGSLAHHQDRGPEKRRSGSKNDRTPAPASWRQTQEAVEAIRAWWEDDNAQVFRLFGYAGTGKTTLARSISTKLGLPPGAPAVLYGAYTGKAASVMRRRGCADASTLHRLIYLPRHEVRARLQELIRLLDETKGPKRRAIENEIHELERELQESGWILNQASVLNSAKLLIVDEVSMVDAKMAADIESFGARMIVLGDPAQLPPVSDAAGYYTRAQPDVLLTEVHRQAFGSPVLDFATRVREGERLRAQRRDGSSIRGRLSWTHALEFEQFIVGKNDTRWLLTDEARDRRGLTDPYPARGDRVICLRNNANLGVVNGETFKVLKSRRLDGDGFELDVRDEDGARRLLLAWADGFEGPKGEERAKDRPDQLSRAVMTYGWAITCHKAQGSQWESVLVVDESSLWREDWNRWLYTAITRAESRVAIRGGEGP